MGLADISLVIAFSGGLLSFLSPCVLPMVPVYLAIMCGSEILDNKNMRVPAFLNSFSFVLGFSVIFISLGAVIGLTGYALNPDYTLLNWAAGILLIAFGIFILASMKVPWLNFEKRVTVHFGGTSGYLRSFLIGAVFSLSWTACVGPILGGILTLAAVPDTAWRGAYLLAMYSLGLGLPFLVIGAAFDSVMPLLRRVQRYSGTLHIISGLLLIGVGILILTGSLGRISSIGA